jgi:hypothetical protein
VVPPVQQDYAMPKPLSADVRDRFRTHFESRSSGRGKSAPFHGFLIELVTQDPDNTLTELRDALEDTLGVSASMSGVDQALRRLGDTFENWPHCGCTPQPPRKSGAQRLDHAKDSGSAVCAQTVAFL